MKYEIVKTADDGYLIFNGKEVTRYDFQQRLKGPIDLNRYYEVKQVLGNAQIVEATNRIEALKNFIDSEKMLTKEVLDQMNKPKN